VASPYASITAHIDLPTWRDSLLTMGPDCLVIDDVEVALAAMTELGRSVAAPGAHAIRARFMEFAFRRRWTVIPHSEFVEWSRHIGATVDVPWLVLDPLFPAESLHNRMTMVRVTRSAGVAEYEVASATTWGPPTNFRQAVGLMDDAAANGGTLRAVARAVEEIGGHATHFAVCAATKHAHDRVLTCHKSAKWRTLVPGHWQISHLRDGCPHLPFTGRRTHHPILHVSNGSSVEVRAPVFLSENNLWQVLYLDQPIRDAVRAARLEVADRLSRELDRPATVADLCLLGSAVPALAPPGESVELRTELANLFS
jgi:hypothetical protein